MYFDLTPTSCTLLLMTEPTKIDVVAELTGSNNNGETKGPVAGFDKHPENINRDGRPKKEWTWRSLLQEVAEEMDASEDGKQEPKKKLMARKLVSKALEGDTTALKEFGDRIDGKASQGIELTGEGGGPVEQSITVSFK